MWLFYSGLTTHHQNTNTNLGVKVTILKRGSEEARCYERRILVNENKSYL